MVEQNFELEQMSQKVFPFSKKTIAARIERVSVAHRNGDQSEVQQILGALRTRHQKITHGFEIFVATRSDLEILKALEPLLLAAGIGETPRMEKILLKYSKFNLTIELVTKVMRLFDIPPEKRGLRFSSFNELVDSQSIENFVFALDFFLSKNIEVKRVEEIFVFEKILLMTDNEIVDLINVLTSRGIVVKIRKREEEIDPNSPPSEAYRPILPDDYKRENWYGFLNQTPWLNSFRNLQQSLNTTGSTDTISIIEDLLQYKNIIKKVVNVLSYLMGDYSTACLYS